MAVAQREVEIVGDDDRGRARIALRAQHREHASCVSGVQARRRFVEEQTPRALAQRLRDDHAACLAARQLVEPALGEVGDVAGLHRRMRGGEVFFGGEAEAPLARESPEQHDLLDGERERELVLLRQVRQVLREVDPARAGRIVAHDSHTPGAHRDEAGDRAEERGLSGTVGPDDDNELALTSAGTGIGHDIAPAEPDGDVLQSEPCHRALPYVNV